MMRVRVSACGALVPGPGTLVWDDYLDHHQYALKRGVEQIIGWFSTWQEIESIRDAAHGDRPDARLVDAAEVLLRHGVLVAENSPRHKREQDIERQWTGWGPLTRAFHFSTRSLASSAYLGVAEDTARLAAKLAESPPPRAFLAFPRAPRIPLPDVDLSALLYTDLVDVLRRRRSHREFGRSDLPLTTVATLLKIVAGPLRHTDGRLAADSQSVFKTSPSGGARHPTEVYLYVQRVRDLEPGMYHYASESHALENLQRRLTVRELVAACGDQDWVADANALIFYTSVPARTAWKYDMGRAYRALLLDVGHLSQTVYLLTTALGLHATFTAALRDELVEQLIGCNPAHEVVIGTSVIGTSQ